MPVARRPSGAEPAGRCRLGVLVNVLDLAVLVEAGRAQFPPDPGLLEAAPLGLRDVGVVVVDPDRPVAKRGGDTLGAGGIGRPDGTRQSVGRVVAEADCVVLGREPLNGDYRPEDLLADDRHVRGAIGEDGRADVEARLEVWLGRPAAAGDESGALVDTKPDVALDLGPMIGRDEGAGLGPLVEPRPDPDAVRPSADLL